MDAARPFKTLIDNKETQLDQCLEDNYEVNKTSEVL